ncbi:hypothetical protein E2562_020027 [Oryza meyeriana var. granulata]|uniref:Uncharacterized protein n=1 Tax=Oryza meyeriana var. granulata TaxID=110450 RepID=A0A6G1FAJ7_9ORYZ|nr:hypothetical protein E2562_020027 [Oryza meyeriana var. granulata]
MDMTPIAAGGRSDGTAGADVFGEMPVRVSCRSPRQQPRVWLALGGATKPPHAVLPGTHTRCRHGDLQFRIAMRVHRTLRAAHSVVAPVWYG